MVKINEIKRDAIFKQMLNFQLPINSIVRIDKDNPPIEYCIYFFHTLDHVLYIGQTKNLAKRVKNHQKNKLLFNLVEKLGHSVYLSIERCSNQKELNSKEKQYILHYKPFLNIQYNNLGDNENA